jgi:hypothetical protein
MGRIEVHRGFRWGNLRDGDHLEDRGINGRIILKCVLEYQDGSITGSVWLRMGTNGGLL